MIFCSMNGLEIVKLGQNHNFDQQKNRVETACLLEIWASILAQSDPCLLTKTKLLYANISMLLGRYGLSWWLGSNQLQSCSFRGK